MVFLQSVSYCCPVLTKTGIIAQQTFVKLSNLKLGDNPFNDSRVVIRRQTTGERDMAKVMGAFLFLFFVTNVQRIILKLSSKCAYIQTVTRTVRNLADTCYLKVNMLTSRRLEFQHPARVTSNSLTNLSVNDVFSFREKNDLTSECSIRLTYFTDWQGKINRFERIETDGINSVELHFKAHYTFDLNFISCNL